MIVCGWFKGLRGAGQFLGGAAGINEPWLILGGGLSKYSMFAFRRWFSEIGAATLGAVGLMLLFLDLWHRCLAASCLPWFCLPWFLMPFKAGHAVWGGLGPTRSGFKKAAAREVPRGGGLPAGGLGDALHAGRRLLRRHAPRTDVARFG